MTGTFDTFDDVAFHEWACAVSCVIPQSIISTGSIFAIYRNLQLRNGSFWLILHLAVPQVAKAWLYFLLLLVKQLTSAFHLILYCKLKLFFWSLTDHVVFALLTAIAWDRYSNIVHPLKAMANSARFRKRAPYFAWSIGIILSLPQIFAPFHRNEVESTTGIAVQSNTTHNSHTICSVEQGFLTKLIYLSYITTGLVGPLIISVICYLLIAFTIWRRRKVGQSNSDALEKSKVKIVKMSVTVLLLFVITWVPFAIDGQLETFNTFSKNDTQNKVIYRYICVVLYCIGAVAVPSIYASFSPEFRRSFKTVFHCSV